MRVVSAREERARVREDQRVVPAARHLVRARAERLDRRQDGLAVAAADAELAVAVVPARKERSVKRAAALIDSFDKRVVAAARDLIDPGFCARVHVVEGYARELPLMRLVAEAQLSRAVETASVQVTRLPQIARGARLVAGTSLMSSDSAHLVEHPRVVKPRSDALRAPIAGDVHILESRLESGEQERLSKITAARTSLTR